MPFLIQNQNFFKNIHIFIHKIELFKVAQIPGQQKSNAKSADQDFGSALS